MAASQFDPPRPSFYCVKCVLYDVSSDRPSRCLKQHVIAAISDLMFVPKHDAIDSSYYTVGADISAGNFDLHPVHENHEESRAATVRVQAWTINENHFYAYNMGVILPGTRFVILTWNQFESTGMQLLLTMVKKIREFSPDILIGVILLVPGQGDAMNAVLEALDATIVDGNRQSHAMTKSFNEFLTTLLETTIFDRDAITTSTPIAVLPLHSLDDLVPRKILPPQFYEDARSFKPLPCSPTRDRFRRLPPIPQRSPERLHELLASQGYTFTEKNTVRMSRGLSVFEVDLVSGTIWVMKSSCLACTYRPRYCTLAKRNLCIVPGKHGGAGYASPATGLDNADLLILAKIYSIEHALLPRSVRRQIPLLLPCLPRGDIVRILWSRSKQARRESIAAHTPQVSNP